jgi:hypothetical protein
VKEALLGWFRHRVRRHAEAPDSASDPFAPIEIRSISNADLTEADIPAEDADWTKWSGIPSFAVSFNGFQHWGSSQKCFEVARRAFERDTLRDLSLTELRTALFWLYSALKHDDMYLTADDLPRAQAIIAEIRDRVKRRAID